MPLKLCVHFILEPITQTNINQSVIPKVFALKVDTYDEATDWIVDNSQLCITNQTTEQNLKTTPLSNKLIIKASANRNFIYRPPHEGYLQSTTPNSQEAFPVILRCPFSLRSHLSLLFSHFRSHVLVLSLLQAIFRSLLLEFISEINFRNQRFGEYEYDILAATTVSTPECSCAKTQQCRAVVFLLPD